MRVLSPRMAPPLACELGSIASTATRSPSSTRAQPRVSMSDDLPAPGGPLIPMRSGAAPRGSRLPVLLLPLLLSPEDSRRSASRFCSSRSSLAACTSGWQGRVAAHVEGRRAGQGRGRAGVQAAPQAVTAAPAADDPGGSIPSKSHRDSLTGDSLAGYHQPTLLWQQTAAARACSVALGTLRLQTGRRGGSGRWRGGSKI